MIKLETQAVSMYHLISGGARGKFNATAGVNYKGSCKKSHENLKFRSFTTCSFTPRCSS